MNKRIIIIAIIMASLFGMTYSSYSQQPDRPLKEREKAKQLRLIDEQLRRKKEFQRQQEFELLNMLYQRSITPDEEQELLEMIQKENPEEAARLKQLKKERPLEFRKILIQRQRDFERLEELKERDPGLYEQKKKQESLERRSHQLAVKYRDSKNQKVRTKIKKELSAALSQLFDLREADREQEIKHLTQRLDHLKSMLAERKKKKQQIVERRMQEMLGEIDVLTW